MQSIAVCWSVCCSQFADRCQLGDDAAAESDDMENRIRASCEWKSVIGCSRFDDSKELATEDGYAIPLGEPFGQFRGLH
jgi:hypothetical protein